MWVRNCPNCNSQIEYKSKYRLAYATRDETWCSRCWRNKRKNTIFSEWSKICPSCGKTVYFKTKYCRKNSIEKNAVCNSCIDRGNIGRIQSEEEKELRASKIRGLTRTLESRKRYAISKRGENNPRYGNHTPKSQEHRRKIRLGCIKTLEAKLRLVGKPLHPGFNPIACKSIDEYGKQHGYNFQHALNGGEYHIKKLGYWVDGYDAEKNVVIEYYEREHERTIRKEKDARRQREILYFMGCKFIIIRENKEVEVVH